MMTGNSRSALITGASSGIGAATAERLAGAGWTVWAGVRDPADGERLERSGQGRIQSIPLDVTDPAAIDAARARITAAGGLDAVVANAGIPVPGPLELVTDDELRRQFDVNVIGCIAVARAMLDLLRESPQPRIVLISSIGGKAAFPFAGPYNASKYAIEALGDAWRLELAPEGIAVVLVEPPAISTPIWDKARDRIGELKARDANGVYRDRLANFDRRLEDLDARGGEPDEVATTVARALDARDPDARYPVGLQARLVAPLRAVLPDAIYDRLAGRATD